MRLPGRHEARFHGNTPSGETGNEGKPNRKPNRFHRESPSFIGQTRECKETGWETLRKREAALVMKPQLQLARALAWRHRLAFWAVAIAQRIIPP